MTVTSENDRQQSQKREEQGDKDGGGVTGV